MNAIHRFMLYSLSETVPSADAQREPSVPASFEHMLLVHKQPFRMSSE